MMTLDALKTFGANTEEGMARCLNDESFYMQMVAMTLEDKSFDALKAALDAGDSPGAFAAAHALKGAVGNVALTPIFEPLCALTELLRGKDAPVDGGGELLEQIMTLREKALSL